jgi:hypothetical protein
MQDNYYSAMRLAKNEIIAVRMLARPLQPVRHERPHILMKYEIDVFSAASHLRRY